METLKPTKGLCSDVAYSPKTKLLEYRVVSIENGEVVYSNAIENTHFAHNIGEFFALVRAVKYAIENKLDLPIFTDSTTALSWYYAKEVRSDVLEDNPKLQPFVEAGLAYLKSLKTLPKIQKWETKQWGEIPADYGRKSRVNSNKEVQNLIETLDLKQENE